MVNWFFNKGASPVPRGKNSLFSKCAGTTASQCAEYWGRTLASQHLRPRPARAKRKTQRVIGVNPHRLGLGHDFFPMTTKGGATKEKKDKLKASVLQRILSRKWEDSSRCGSVAEPSRAPRGHQFGARLGRCPGSGLSPQEGTCRRQGALYLSCRCFYLSPSLFKISKNTGKKKKVRRQPAEWEKTFASHISGKGVVCSIDKELLEFSSKES